MKIKTFTLIALLGILAVGCQKENQVETSITNNTPAEAKTTTIMRYDVNGTTFYDTLYSAPEVDAFYDNMLTLAYSGDTVTIYGNTVTAMTEMRDVVTFSTDDAQKAKAWIAQKHLDGYDVTIQYDPETGKYNCTASR